jgi:hypothetical protein
MRTLVAALIASFLPIAVSAQNPPIVDVATIGPEVGERVPDFAGTDQFGRRQTLQSILGPKGALIVFYRSAEW